MAFLDWFKNKFSKSDASPRTGSSPVHSPVSVTPKAAMQQAPQAHTTSQKSVVPKSIQPLNLSSQRTTAPLGLKSTGPIRLEDPKVPAIKTKPSSAPDPVAAMPEKHIELEISDFIGQVPAEMIAADGPDASEKIKISSKQFASDLARGKASIPLATLYGINPAIFTPEAAASDISIPLPLRKIVPQIGEFKLRGDQRDEEGPAQNYETPFLKGAIRDGAEISAIAPKPASAGPSTLAPASSPPISMQTSPLKVAAPKAVLAPETRPAEPTPLSIKMPPLEAAAPAPAPMPTPAVDKPAPRPLSGYALPSISSPGDGDVQIRRRPPATVRATVAGGKIRISGKPGTPSLAVTPPTPNVSSVAQSGLPKPFLHGLNPLTVPTPTITPTIKATPPIAATPSLPTQPAEPATHQPTHAEDPAPASAASGPAVNIPLMLIIDSIPGAVVEGDLASLARDTEVPVPLSLITSQLSRGSIKISVGALTGLLPDSLKRIFQDASSDDEIPLPLNYVLSHLPADAFAQRSDQIDERPDMEIPTPFSQKAKEDADRLQEEESQGSGIETVDETIENPEPVEIASEPEPTEEEVIESHHEPEPAEESAAPVAEVPVAEPEAEAPPEPATPSLPPSIFAPTSPDVRSRHARPFISRRALRTIDAAEGSGEKPPLAVPAQPVTSPASQSQEPAEEEPRVAEVSSKQAAAEGLAELQDIFMTDDALDARAIARLCTTLPGVASVVFSTRDGLHLAGGIEGFPSLSALCALVPQAYDRTVKFAQEATIGHTASITIATGEDLFSVFGERGLYVVVKHDARELKPGIRAKLQCVASGLSSMYALPASSSDH